MTPSQAAPEVKVALSAAIARINPQRNRYAYLPIR
jgi:hypothetical protein